MKRFLMTIASMLLTMTFSAPAFVTDINSSGNTRRWNLLTPQSGVSTNVVNTNTHAIRFHLANDGFSATNTTAELNALRASFGQWQAISNTYIKFEDAGIVAPRTTINTSDNTNTIFWAKSSTLVGGGNDISGALGVTFITFGVSDNVIKQGDIVFNGVLYGWFADFFSTNTTDKFIEGVALHEIGHFLGLQHSPMGAATMLWVGGSGISVQSGLSSDDISGARHLYPAAITNYGAIKGNITKNGSPILGAAVFARDLANNTVAGTVSDASGNFLISALTPGNYQVRVASLDSSSASDFLVRGSDIVNPTYNSADTTFLPTTNKSVTITANTTNTADFAVTTGTPVFSIAYIRKPATSSGSYSISSLPTSLRAGTSNRFIGVFSANLPTSGATFTVTGDGITLGTPTYQPGNVFAGLNGISIPISISSNATAGARDIIITQGANVAYASGFFEVQGTNTDYNFDGLEDTFQRTYFPVFTATNASPGSDPDGDNFNNYAEHISGTFPTNSASFLNIQSVTRNGSGATIVWQSGTGKKYQVSTRTNITSGTWQNIGSPVIASSMTAQYLDVTATNAVRFYRVQALP